MTPPPLPLEILIDENEDVYESVIAFLRGRDIPVCRVTGSGAVRSARIVCYDQKTMQSAEHTITGELEIVSLTGEAGVRSGEAYAHLHVVLADERGNGKGGHVLPGGLCALRVVCTLS